MTKTLYHFTNVHHWDSIQADGQINVTESNVGSISPWLPPYGEHVGPDVVWLTDTTSSRGLALEPPLHVYEPHERDAATAFCQAEGTFDKKAVRLTVELPEDECHQWRRWVKRYDMNPEWKRIFQSGREPYRWWVIERPILLSEIVDVLVTHDERLEGPEVRGPLFVNA